MCPGAPQAAGSTLLPGRRSPVLCGTHRWPLDSLVCLSVRVAMYVCALDALDGCCWLLMLRFREAANKEKAAISQTLDAARKKFAELDADDSGYLAGKPAAHIHMQPRASLAASHSPQSQHRLLAFAG